MVTSKQIPGAGVAFFVMFVTVFASVFPGVTAGRGLQGIGRDCCTFVLSVLSVRSTGCIDCRTFLCLSGSSVRRFAASMVEIVRFVGRRYTRL